MKTLIELIQIYAFACEDFGYCEGQYDMDEMRDDADIKRLRQAEQKKERAKKQLLKVIGSTGDTTNG